MHTVVLGRPWPTLPQQQLRSLQVLCYAPRGRLPSHPGLTGRVDLWDHWGGQQQRVARDTAVCRIAASFPLALRRRTAAWQTEGICAGPRGAPGGRRNHGPPGSTSEP